MAGLTKIITLREEVLKAVEAWASEEVRVSRGYVAYFCPMCARVEEVSRSSRGFPRCPVHQMNMMRFDEGLFRERRAVMAALLRKRLDAVLELFWKAVDAYTPVPEVKWRLESGGELVVKPDIDPTEFRYVPAEDALEAFFYRYSPEADRILEEGARGLGLKYRAEAMANQEVPSQYKFSRAKMLYVKEVDA
jgi:hypothetical protein